MIELTKLKGKKFFLNCDIIETVEENPDTTITLRNGKLLIVEEKPRDVVNLVIEFKRKQLNF